MTDRLRHFTPTAETSDDLRRAFGRFGTGVALVTVQTDHGPLGMTANSFSSVSLAPPLVLWSAATNSKRHDAFADAKQFAIHVLRADQRDIAELFARRGDGFDACAWAPGPNGAPTLEDSLASFHCDTWAIHPAGDHSVILGQITHASFDSDEAAPALMFEQSRFGAFNRTNG